MLSPTDAEAGKPGGITVGSVDNEPVAWRKSETDSEGQYFVYREEEPRWLEGYIPLYTHPAEPKELTVPENSQDWKGMDGATAFWLIERHSNHWDDARLMMEEWLKANTHPAKTLTDEEIIEIGNAVTNLIDSNEGWIEFARAILRKAQGD